MKYFYNLLTLFVLSSSISLSQTTLNVPSQYSTIQAALNAAKSGDTILVQPGTYKENIIWPGVNGIKLISANGCKNTTIDGNKISSVINFLSHANIDTNTVIKGFSIINGGNVQQGAGIKSTLSWPLLDNLVISDNNCSSGIGGGVYSYGIVIRNSTIIRNYANIGGGMYVGSERYTRLENVDFESNWANNGGGIYIEWNPNVIFSKVLFRNNTATDGGAIKSSGKVKIEQVTFSKNIAQFGGAISCTGVGNGPSIYNNTFIGNHAIRGSAILISSGCNATVYNNNFVKNSNSIYSDNNSAITNASNNYWSNSYGPYHQSQNPNGRGDSVSFYVNVIPFLTTSDTLAPLIPIEGIKVLNASSNSISLQWNKSLLADLKSYKIYYDTRSHPDQYINSLEIGLDTSYTITNLQPGIKYYFAITCLDRNNNESIASEEIGVNTVLMPRITIDQNKVDFDTVDVSLNKMKSLKFTNTGTAVLNFKSFQLESTAFILDKTPVKLDPGNSTTLDITFTPKSTGSFKADLKIVTDAANDSIFIIPLSGFGVLPKAPVIVSIKDVPDDQGGEVRITFQRSRYDGLDSTQKIIGYSVWRQIQGSQWDAINQFYAIRDSIYYVVSPTLGDSTINGVVWSTYRVTAHTSDPDVFYTSDPAVGYSTDNIAPAVPKGFTAVIVNNKLQLKWNSLLEKDFQYYAIYRSTDPNFSADTMKKYTYTTIDTVYVDSDVKQNQKYYYKIAAVDYAGNKSSFSMMINAIITGVDDPFSSVPAEYSLSQNYPNPFNPVTVIRYGMPENGHVRITVYNLLGEVTGELINGEEGAGYHELFWNASNVASGVYLYAIEVWGKDGRSNFKSLRKMVLMK